MPSSTLIDEGVVRMRMDDEQFEKGAERTMNTIDKLKKSLNFKDAKLGEVDTSPFDKAIDRLSSKVEIFKKRVVENLADSTVNMMKNIATGVDYISPGFQKYEDQVASIQKLMNATHATMEEVQKVSDKILKFTDETSYEYTSMMSTLSSFTSSGMGMEDAANTILGMAIAAGQAGVNAKDATHAFMGFQKAIASGYMGSAHWDWIRTAGMNSAELKKQLLEAAVATGDLQKGADGVYYAIKETSKGTKQIAVTVENFEQSFADKWLSGDAIKKAMSVYSKAFNQIYDISEKTGEQIFEIIDPETSKYLEFLDQYSLDAFNAGQETKTWSDAMEALKSAMSSGWMKSFELIIGNYEQATDFFSNLIEPLYDIFVAPGGRRNEFLEYAFGQKGIDSSGVKKTVANWGKLKAKLDETGHSVSEVEEAFRKVVSSSEDAEVRALADRYRDLEEAIKQGAVSGDLLNEVLNNLAGVSTDSSAAMVEGAVDATAALEKYKQVAMEVLRGDYGDGQARKDALAEMGLDYDLVQWLAGNLRNGKGFDAINLEWLQSTAPNAYQHFIDVIGNGNLVIDSATGQIIALGDVVDELTEAVDPLTDKISKMTGRELWQGSVINIIKAFSEVLNALGEAFNNVFGDAESRGKGFRNILEWFYRFTLNLTPGSKALDNIRSGFEGIFKVVKVIPSFIGKITSGSAKLASIVFKLLDKVSELFTGKNYFEGRFGRITGLLSILGKAVEWVWDKVSFLLDAGLEGLGIAINWLKELDLKSLVKPIKDLFTNESGIGKFFSDLISPFITLFGERGEGGIFARIRDVFTNFTTAASDVTRSVDNMDASVQGALGKFGELTEATKGLGDVLNGDEESWKDRVRKMWDTFKNVVSEEYQKINWSTVLDAGKAGLLGYLVLRLNELFKNTNRLLRTPMTGLSGLIKGIIYPFQVLGETISKHEKADRYLKIAAAIGVLALSLLMLAQIPEDTFSTVVMGMALLLWIMMKMAKATDSFSIFSGNTKNVSKNNPVTNTVKAFENLQEAFKLSFQGNKFNLNVFSNMAQVLVALGITLAIIVGSINKIHDTVKTVDDLRDLVPTLLLISGILAVLMLVGGVMAAVSKEAPNSGRLAIAILGLVLAMRSILNSIISIGKLSRDDLDWTAMLVMLGMMVTIMGVIGFVLKSASGMVKQGQSVITSGSAVWAIAGIMLSIAVMIRSLVKTMEKASKIENLTKGLAVVAGLLIGISAVIAIMSAIVSNDKQESSSLMKLAGSMIILALSLSVLVPALLLLARLPSDGLLAAAGALGIVVLAMAVAMSTLSSVNPSNLLKVGAVIALIVIAFGALAAGSALLVTAMLGVAQIIPWDTITGKLSEFFNVIKSEWFLITMLVVAVVALGIGFLGCGIGAAGFGIGLAGVAAAIYIVALAIPILVDSVIYLMGQIQSHGWELVAFVGLVLSAILAVMVLKRMEVVKVMAMYADAIISFIQAPATISKILKVLAILLFSCFTFLQDMLGPITDRVIKLLVALINGIADAIRNNKDNIAGAFWNLVSALIELLLSVLGEGLNLSKKVYNKIRKWIYGDDPAYVVGAKAYTMDADSFEFIVDEDGIEKEAKAAMDTAATAAANGYHEGLAEADLSADEEELSQLLNEWADEPETQQSVKDGGYEAGLNLGNVGKTSLVNGLVDSMSGDVTSMIGEFGGGDLLGDPSKLMASGLGTGGLGDMASSLINNSLNGTEVAATAKDGGTNIAGNWIGGLSTSLTSQVNTESILGSIGNLISGTFNSDTTKKNFHDSGAAEAQANIEGITEYVSGEEAIANLKTSAEGANDQFASGWETRSSTNIFTMAQNTIIGLVNRIREAVDAHMRSAGEYAFDTLQGAYETRAEINSPSKVMEREGEYTADGLIKGIQNKLGEANAAGQNLGNSIFDGNAQSIATRIAGAQASSEMERWKALQDTQESLYWRQQDLNAANAKLNGGFYNPWDDYTAEATSSDSWVDAIEGSLNDEANQSEVTTAIGNMIGMTFDGETSTFKFTESGTNNGLLWTEGLSTGIISEESTSLLETAGMTINDAASQGWNTASDVNTPLMAGYLVAGVTNSFYNDQVLQQQLEQVGASIYYSVERGMQQAAGIASPSKEMAKNGMYLMLGLVDGLEEGQNMAFSSGVGSAGTLLDAFHNAITQMLATINSDMSIEPVITPVVDMSQVNSAISGIQNGFGEGYNVSAELVNDIRRRNRAVQSASETQAQTPAPERGAGIVVNVYPSAGMDERALADKVYYRIMEADYRTRVAKG